MIWFKLFVFLAVITGCIAKSKPIGDFGLPFDTKKCSLPKSVVTEIQGYQTIANEIFSSATQKSFKGKTYRQLEFITDTYGPRPTGSQALSTVLDYIVKQLKRQGLANVREEQVDVPAVKAGLQYGHMVKPRYQKIGIAATGYSTSTSPLGVLAYIVMIPTEEFFLENKAKVFGKIAVIDYVIADLDPMIFKSIEEAGAVAIIYRSFVSFSIYSMALRAGPRSVRIPVTFVTNEDVDLFVRLTKRGYEVKLHIVINNQVTMVKSRNIMADFPGRLKPEEIVLMSGHADSWYYAEAAQDDGVGVALTLEIPKLLKKLNLIPKRTVRSVFWTGEEFGLIGSKAFIKTHARELPRYSAAFEADKGCFKPMGFIFGNMSIQFGCILNEIMKLQQTSIGAEYLHIGELTTLDIPTDILVFAQKGVPAANLNGDAGRLFWYKHTKADTMSIVDSGQLDRCLAFMATTVYIVADMENMAPRN